MSKHDTCKDDEFPISTISRHSPIVFVDIMNIRIIRDFSGVRRSNINVRISMNVIHMPNHSTYHARIAPMPTMVCYSCYAFVDIMIIRITPYFCMLDEATV